LAIKDWHSDLSNEQKRTKIEEAKIRARQREEEAKPQILNVAKRSSIMKYVPPKIFSKGLTPLKPKLENEDKTRPRPKFTSLGND